jgi:hypothetical protein
MSVPWKMAKGGLSAYFISSHGIFQAMQLNLLYLPFACLFIWDIGVNSQT